MLNNAVILAGGKSSRMGEDKALMPFGGYNSMTEYQYRRLEKIFKNVYISAKENKFNFEANIILDKYPQSSPMVAIASILEELNNDFFLISVDMPLLSTDAIEALIDLYNKEPEYDIYVLQSPNGDEPTATIYTKKILNNLRVILDKKIHKLQYLLNNLNKATIKWDNRIEFVNVNDKSSYLYAKKQKMSIKW